MSHPREPRFVVHRLALARLVSLSGTQAAYIALLSLVYARSGGSGAWIAGVLLAALAARVAVSPWAGLAGDRFDRRRVMFASDLAAAACFVAIAEARSLWAVLALGALAAIAEAPFSPASSALIAMVVTEERRAWGNGLVAAGSSIGTLLGAVCGGALVAAFGPRTAFLVNAASFVLSAAVISSVRGRFRVDAQLAAQHSGVLRGVRFLASEPILRTATLSVGLVALGLGMANVAELPLFVHIGAGRVGYGIAIAAWAAGMIVCSRLASRIVGWRRERLGVIGGCVLLAGAVGLSGAVPVFPVVAGLFVFGGVANALVNVSLVLIAQRRAPAALQSRAIAAVEAIVNAAIGASLILGGLLLSPLAPAGVFLLAGALGVVAACLAFRLPGDSTPIRPQPAATPASAARDTDPSAPRSCRRRRTPNKRPSGPAISPEGAPRGVPLGVPPVA